MRRDTFLKSMLALAASGALPLSAWANANLKMMIPANPGGGWDTTGRALGKALQEAGAAASVSYDNKGGAAGAIGLAQFVNGSKADPNALMVMGAVMLGGIITGKPPVSLSQATPIARLTSEYNVFVLPANSPLKSMKDVVEQMKKDPGSVKWGGGSRGSTEHIAAAMIAREVGVDPAKINYVAFRGGGEATAAILGGNVTVGGSGYSEFAEYITTGKMRALAVTSDTRLKGIDVPTLKEQGINVVLGNWRGVYGASGITPDQRKALTDMVLKATKTKAWAEALEKNNWTPAMLTGPAFDKFVDDEFASLRAVMVKSGMLGVKNPQALIGAGTLALGALLAAGATQISSEAGYAGVGPNFLPWLVAAVLAVCGVFLLREALSGGFRDMDEPSGADAGHWKGFVWVSIGILLNAALITAIGFILSCTLCFVLAVQGFNSAEGRLDLRPGMWIKSAAIGFLIAAPVYWMFTKLLAINLPGLTSTGWL